MVPRFYWWRMARLRQDIAHGAIHRHYFSQTSKASNTTAYKSTIPGGSINLPDGRQMGYHTAGPADGTPVFYIHGHPDSGLVITGELEKRVARELNIRWIGPDRPGVGLSSRHDSQSVANYPLDLQCLIDHLALDNYYILGTSGGTGFTLACAQCLPPSQLSGVGVIAGIGPLELGYESMDKTQLRALEAWRDHPTEFQEHYEKKYVPLAQLEDPQPLEDIIREEFEATFSGEDQDALLETNTLREAVRGLRQHWIQGAWAHAKGMEVHWRPWGFDLEQIPYPGIRFWYGSDDISTTPVMGKYMAAQVKGGIYREFVGASHYTIWRDGILQDVLRDLLSSKMP